MTGGRICAVVAGWLVSVAFIVAGQVTTPPPGSAPQPTFRSEVEAVQMDVLVTDADDRPVTGLTKDDFEVFENGQPQVITTFAPVSMPFERSTVFPEGMESDVTSNTRPYRHIYLILLADVGDTSIALRTRYLLRRFITDYFSDDDVAAVVTLAAMRTADTQDFTSNRRLLLDAVDRFAGGGVGASGAVNATEDL